MGRQRARQEGFTLIELLIVVAIIAIIAAIAIPNLLNAMTRSRKSALAADGRTLFTAFTSYNADKNEYPPCCSPPSEALDKATLSPLTRDGYLPNGSGIAAKLRGGALTAYDSPDNPTANHDFYAVMTHPVADLQLLVADTDEYPGFTGTLLAGLYWIEGSTLVPIGDDT